MKQLRLIPLAIALLAGPLMAQTTTTPLPEGHYLVGTMGWDE